MTRESQTRSISDSNSGPTLAELADFVNAALAQGIDPQLTVNVTRSKGYNQFDRGEWRLSVTA
ncbi:MAG: hypothetical protein RR853_08890 [Aurantimicrobium sp.]|uniref:hypothetical protein n=1 Tax=Aurantimicrobium sp. TaxID=1930784 RepID=UPI002FC9A9DC